MGLLDDAIREHLDLKRMRGADPSEVIRQEREALGRAAPVAHEEEEASEMGDEPRLEPFPASEPESDFDGDVQMVGEDDEWADHDEGLGGSWTDEEPSPPATAHAPETASSAGHERAEPSSEDAGRTHSDASEDVRARHGGASADAAPGDEDRGYEPPTVEVDIGELLLGDQSGDVGRQVGE